ncbi:unnamed protein product, partial [Discosporangium mesarthrocarpum]
MADEREQHDTLPEALAKWAERQPNKSLWTYLDDSGHETQDKVTYRELSDATQALASALLRGGNGRPPVSPGDRVLLVYPPSLHFMVAFVACLRAGIIAVPVYPPDPRKLGRDVQAFTKTAESCAAKVALTSSAYGHVKKMAEIKARVMGEDARWPEGLHWVVTNKGLATPAAADKEGEEAAGKPPDRSSVAFLQYTSGSTSDPKGVRITHGNLAHNLHSIIVDLEAGEGTVVVSWLPQYHDMGLIGSVLGVLYCGGTGFYLSPLDFVRSPTTWMRAASDFGATHLQAPNFGYALTVRKWRALRSPPKLDLSHVVHMINAAEPIDSGSMDSFMDTFRVYGLREGVIKPTYGLAEHTVFVCSGGSQRLTVDKRCLEVGKQVVLFDAATAEKEKRDRDGVDTNGGARSAESQSNAWCEVIGCGYPFRVEGMEAIIVQPETRVPLPEDMVGEVWLRSPSKAHGYWGQFAKSLEAFCALPSAETVATSEADSTGGEEEKGEGLAGDDVRGDGAEEAAVEEGKDREVEGEGTGKGHDWSVGFLRTGDEGFLHKGELFICGRIKDLVIIAGRNHYPQDIEKTAERGRNDSLRPGCSAAFSIPSEGGGRGEELVLSVELREDKV